MKEFRKRSLFLSLLGITLMTGLLAPHVFRAYWAGSLNQKLDVRLEYFHKDYTPPTTPPAESFSRVCGCKRELNLLPVDGKGIAPGDTLVVDDGNEVQTVLVKEVGDRTFFHKIDDPKNGEYRIQVGPRVFVKVDKPLVGLDPKVKITIQPIKGTKVVRKG